jgi:hypothetical protein
VCHDRHIHYILTRANITPITVPWGEIGQRDGRPPTLTLGVAREGSLAPDTGGPVFDGQLARFPERRVGPPLKPSATCSRNYYAL